MNKRPYRQRIPKGQPKREVKTVRVLPTVWEGLDTLCSGDGVSQGEMVEGLIIKELELRKVRA